MRVRQDTPERLVLEDRPWVMGIAMAGGVLIFVAVAITTLAEAPWLAVGMLGGAALFGGIGAVLIRRSIAIFDRAAGAMVWREVRIGATREETVALRDIRAAVVQTGSTGGSGATTRRCALRVDGRAEVLPLTVVYSSGSGAVQAAEAVNRWLAGNRPA
ncbi:MAG: hypothetical protein KF887_05910 [Paracoccaceae bacterium]|nr:MAG: hypothetical protein KF887_05910 [Paracoccaceae bacterium]